MNKTKLYWLLQVSGWFTYGVIQFLVLSYDGQPIDRMWILGEGLQMLGNILLTHSFRFIIIRFKWLNFHVGWQVVMGFLGIIFMSIAAAFLWMLIILLQSGFHFSGLPVDDVIQAMVAGLLESLFVFSFWTFFYFIYLYIERYNKSLKYEASIREIELKNLKSQLNPHFIFNALNSIRALVDENPEKSKESITQLSHILRNSLNSDRQKLVPFSEEFKTVQDYLGLESIRYEERLRTQFELDERTDEFEIPPLMLQTIVENGIKHGIAKLTKGGEISIKTKVDEDSLRIEVRNSGQLKVNSKKEGFGIANTVKRLSLIYGDQASFSIKNENSNTVLTKIKIPK